MKRTALAKLRAARGFTQEALAERLRKTRTSVQNWERGTSMPPPGTCLALAQALGISMAELLHMLDETPGGPKERLFFGTVSVTVAIPLRTMPNRTFPVVSSEDDRARQQMTAILAALSLPTRQEFIPPDGLWSPTDGDSVIICGPASSQVTVEALKSDPFIEFSRNPESGLWQLTERASGKTFTSPLDEAPPVSPPYTDLAYVGRLLYRGRSMLIVAGIHALGSVGAVHYLGQHIRSLYQRLGTHRFSMVVRSEHNEEAVIRSELLCPAQPHN